MSPFIRFPHQDSLPVLRSLSALCVTSMILLLFTRSFAGRYTTERMREGNQEARDTPRTTGDSSEQRWLGDLLPAA